MKSKLTFLVMIIIGSLNQCKNKNEDKVNLAVDSVLEKNGFSLNEFSHDRNLLQGAWSVNSEDGAVFLVEGDSIDFFEFDPPKKYYYLVFGQKLIVYTDKYVPPDSIKQGSYVLDFHIEKLTKDTLIMKRYENNIMYQKVLTK